MWCVHGVYVPVESTHRMVFAVQYSSTHLTVRATTSLLLGPCEHSLYTKKAATHIESLSITKLEQSVLSTK